MPDQESGSEVAYRAFISYSHLDATSGRKLHRRLESYRIPARLVGTETLRGRVPPRLSPIFRDLDELPAADDLSTEIKAALFDSAALIVVCSPAAKASKWVAREIETFRALHGASRPVLAALIEGEPDTAFPDALYAAPAPGGRVDPAAADFRKGGEGSRLALMKLVAGLTGANLDALVQRDAQARIRRVTAVTVAAITAMLIMALLLVMAVRSQNEARRQRAEAEGLVEYMLTDLRDRLKGVGRLDVMTAVNERAMAYYGDQAALDDLTPQSLDRRARILHAMGEDDEKRGDLALALAKFKEAHRATAAVLAKRPDDPDAIFAHAQSEYWVGYAAYMQRLHDQALHHFGAYARLAEKLVSMEPSRAKWQREAAYAQGNICTLLLETGAKSAAAVSTCAASRDAMIKALQAEPTSGETRLAVINRREWLAKARHTAGQNQRALEERLAARNEIQALVAREPKNADYRQVAAINALALVEIYREQGRTKDADRILDEAYATTKELKTLDPENRATRKLLQDINNLKSQ